MSYRMARRAYAETSGPTVDDRAWLLSAIAPLIEIRLSREDESIDWERGPLWLQPYYVERSLTTTT
ncbi:MAG: hypothetical protein AAF609_00615 [Cyanobacteria bacterium P01_C01_bin.120]